MDNNWVLSTTINTVKQIGEHPFLSTLGAAGLLIFEQGFGATQTVFVAYLLYVILIGFDWLTGTSAAKKDGIDTSAYGIDGVKRTIFLLMIPVIARLLDIIMTTNVILTGIVIAILARSIARSVIANAKRAGWDKWVPMWALDWVVAELEHKDARAKQRLDEITKKDGDAK